MNIPTAHSTESLERFLQHIVDAPKPRQVTVTYLRKNGFGSGNDPELRHIFRLLGFLRDDDTLWKRWDLYKDNGREVLREAISECYKELFNLYPDAFARADNELALWFQPPVTSDSKTSIKRAIRTFRKLCQIAGYTADAGFRSDNIEKPVKSMPVTFPPKIPQGLASNQQLIIQLPLSSNQTDYERMFEAIKRVFY